MIQHCNAVFNCNERVCLMLSFFRGLNLSVEKTIASSFCHVALGQQSITNTGQIIYIINRTIKRGIDILMSIIFLLMSMPLFIIISIAIKLTSKGPIFFKQERVGYKGKNFNIYKFRTMRQETTENEHEEYVKYLLNEDSNVNDQSNLLVKHIAYVESKITKIGGFLRASSLDELPQIFNIIKGDMSLVGPRPHPVYEVKEYKKWYYRRLDVKPGLTGWSKLNLRCTPKYYEEAILYDLWYVDHWNLGLDMLILFMTVPFVLSMNEAF